MTPRCLRPGAGHHPCLSTNVALCCHLVVYAKTCIFCYAKQWQMAATVAAAGRLPEENFGERLGIKKQLPPARPAEAAEAAREAGNRHRGRSRRPPAPQGPLGQVRQRLCSMAGDRPRRTAEAEVTNNTREKRRSVMGLPMPSRAQEGQYPLGVQAGAIGFHTRIQKTSVCVWCEYVSSTAFKAHRRLKKHSA